MGALDQRSNLFLLQCLNLQAIKDTETMLNGIYDCKKPFVLANFPEYFQLFSNQHEPLLVWRTLPQRPSRRHGMGGLIEGEPGVEYLAVVSHHGQETERIMFMRSTLTGCDEAELVDREAAKEIQGNCKLEVLIAFDIVMEQLKLRFPKREESEAQSLVDIHFWLERPHMKTILQHVQVIQQQYGEGKRIKRTGMEVAAFLCSKTLDAQMGRLDTVMCDLAQTVQQRHAARVAEAIRNREVYTGGSATAMLWEAVESSAVFAAAISEYVKYAKLVLVMVGSSVEDERTFSSMAFIQSDNRSSFKAPHLDACLRMYCTKNLYTLGDFPVDRVYDVWAAAKARRLLEAKAAPSANTVVL